MLSSRTKVGHPAHVFRYNGEDEKKMQVQFARICVLYDDLMREYAGANADQIKELDGSGLNARRFYFVAGSWEPCPSCDKQSGTQQE